MPGESVRHKAQASARGITTHSSQGIGSQRECDYKYTESEKEEKRPFLPCLRLGCNLLLLHLFSASPGRIRRKGARMHRSSSTTRASDEYYLSTVGVGMGMGMGMGGRSSSSSVEIDQLPTFDPLSDAAKKEALRARFAENMVHIIPLVLILCALVLWCFSHPEIDLASKDDSIIARIKNMTIDGYSNWNGSSMTIGLEDLDPIDQIGLAETGRELDNKEPE